MRGCSKNRKSKRWIKTQIVSLTDHDNIEAPVSLQVLDECRGTPISVEWTVSFGPTFFHLGVHNLPAGARPRTVGGDGRVPAKAARQPGWREMLAALASIGQVLIVFNHPLWDERGIGQAAHREMWRSSFCGGSDRVCTRSNSTGCGRGRKTATSLG